MSNGPVYSLIRLLFFAFGVALTVISQHPIGMIDHPSCVCSRTNRAIRPENGHSPFFELCRAETRSKSISSLPSTSPATKIRTIRAEKTLEECCRWTQDLKVSHTREGRQRSSVLLISCEPEGTYRVLTLLFGTTAQNRHSFGARICWRLGGFAGPQIA